MSIMGVPCDIEPIEGGLTEKFQLHVIDGGLDDAPSPDLQASEDALLHNEAITLERVQTLIAQDKAHLAVDLITRALENPENDESAIDSILGIAEQAHADLTARGETSMAAIISFKASNWGYRFEEPAKPALNSNAQNRQPQTAQSSAPSGPALPGLNAA